MSRPVFVLLSAALVHVSATAADPSLMNLVMPDSKIVAGLQVTQAKNSPFGSWVLSRMQFDDPDFLKFIEATGFDPRRDVREVLIASNALKYDPSNWLVLAKGSFDALRIAEAARSHGARTVRYQGYDILTIATSETSASDPKPASAAVAFVEPGTAIMGEITAVQAAIDRRKAHAGVPPALATKIRQISAGNDFWFTTLVPLSEFAAAMPDPNLSSAMKGNLLGAVQQASGGLKFGQTIHLNAEAITRSPKDASALVDVVKFIAGLIQTNRQKDDTAAQVSTLLDALQTSAAGNVMTMSLAIPEGTLEQMITSARQQRNSPSKRTVPAPATPK